MATEKPQASLLAPAARYRELLERDDPEAAVQALGELEFGQLVLAVGRDDAMELLALSSGRQLRALVDLQCWRGDHFDHDRLLDWLQPYQEAGPGRLARAFLSLDAELTALLLLEELRIYLVGEDDDPGGDHELLPTPDPRVLVEIVVDDDERAGQLRSLLEAMFRRDPTGSVRALLEMRAALPAELEEQAFRWRSARLADLGFPALEEALAVYSQPGAAQPAARSWEASGLVVQGQVPALYSESLSDGLLSEALAAVPGERAEALQAALVNLLNQVLVADRVELGDARGIRESAAAARDLLQLGLTLEGADTGESAAALLLARGPREIFRAGHARVADLARRVRGLARQGLLAGDPPGELIDRPGSEVVAALVGTPRPRYSRLLDEPPVAAQRPFASPADVARAEATLDRVEAGARLVHQRLGMPARAIRSLAGECDKAASLGNAFRSAVVGRALGAERFEVEVLEPGALDRFRDLAILDGEPPALAPDLARQLDQGLEALIAELPEGLHEAAHSVVRAWLAELVEELGSLPRDQDVDPRFVGGFLVRA